MTLKRCTYPDCKRLAPHDDLCDQHDEVLFNRATAPVYLSLLRETALYVDDRDDGWKVEARCEGTDTENFYSEQPGPHSDRSARELCGRCPVRAECLAFALRMNDPYGMWGGLDGKERRAIRPKVESYRKEVA